MADEIDGAASVTDHRTSPRGVLPRNLRLYGLLALALGIVVIAFLGRPTERSRDAKLVAERTPLPLNAERLKTYQTQLRQTDDQARERAAVPPPVPLAAPTARGGRQTESPDPAKAERAKRDYESLFASNVVVSRRPVADQPVGSAPSATRTAPGRSPASAPPSVDDIADSVIRASQRAAGPAQSLPGVTPVTSPVTRPGDRSGTPDRTPPISASGPLHPLLEGSLIDAVLTNRLDGSSASPVNALVTNPVFSHRGDVVLIPAGARVLGETKPVQNFGETRLAVSFHRVIFPDGSTQSLDQDKALDQSGAMGLHDQVNNHLMSTFGISAAVGLINGLGQAVGNRGLGGGDGNNRTVVVAGDVGNSTSQATQQTLSRYLNRLPSITIREGHRLKVVLIHDLLLPAYPVKEPR